MDDKTELTRLVEDWSSRFDDVILPAITHSTRVVQLIKQLNEHLIRAQALPNSKQEIAVAYLSLLDVVEELMEVMQSQGEDAVLIGDNLRSLADITMRAVEMIPDK